MKKNRKKSENQKNQEKIRKKQQKQIEKQKQNTGATQTLFRPMDRISHQNPRTQTFSKSHFGSKIWPFSDLKSGF